mmetsp:Transcript_116391/g.232060  ORF Transcript_116391/g.232060 Transcript_116391/m.232060 type:complete len:236 (-) Transcript_116391:22-729(-)
MELAGPLPVWSKARRRGRPMRPAITSRKRRGTSQGVIILTSACSRAVTGNQPLLTNQARCLDTRLSSPSAGLHGTLNCSPLTMTEAKRWPRPAGASAVAFNWKLFCQSISGPCHKNLAAAAAARVSQPASAPRLSALCAKPHTWQNQRHSSCFSCGKKSRELHLDSRWNSLGSNQAATRPHSSAGKVATGRPDALPSMRAPQLLAPDSGVHAACSGSFAQQPRFTSSEAIRQCGL